MAYIEGTIGPLKRARYDREQAAYSTLMQKRLAGLQAGIDALASYTPPPQRGISFISSQAPVLV